MRVTRLMALLALVVIGTASLTGCVFEKRHDGGVTVRPVH